MKYTQKKKHVIHPYHSSIPRVTFNTWMKMHTFNKQNGNICLYDPYLVKELPSKEAAKEECEFGGNVGKTLRETLQRLKSNTMEIEICVLLYHREFRTKDR